MQKTQLLGFAVFALLLCAAVGSSVSAGSPMGMNGKEYNKYTQGEKSILKPFDGKILGIDIIKPFDGKILGMKLFDGKILGMKLFDGKVFGIKLF